MTVNTLREFRYEFNDAVHTIRLEPQPDGSFIAYLHDQAVAVSVTVEADGALNVLIDGRRVRAYANAGHTDTRGARHHHVALLGGRPLSYELKTALNGSRRRGARAGAGSLDAPMPGQVIEVLVTEGDHVAQGDPLLILEAMKMEIRVTAPHDGTVTHLNVAAGDTVDRGESLAQVEPDER